MDPFKMCHCGGIVGCAVGESQSNIVKISNCSNSGALENKRSTAAGIVGFAKYAAVSDCRFTGSVVGSGPHFAAGIAGCLSDASVTDCIVKSPDIYSHSSLGFKQHQPFSGSGNRRIPIRQVIGFEVQGFRHLDPECRFDCQRTDACGYGTDRGHFRRQVRPSATAVWAERSIRDRQARFRM